MNFRKLDEFPEIDLSSSNEINILISSRVATETLIPSSPTPSHPHTLTLKLV